MQLCLEFNWYVVIGVALTSPANLLDTSVVASLEHPCAGLRVDSRPLAMG